jgi:hypothetical protein
MRGGGVYVGTQSIRIAFYAYQQQQARTKPGGHSRLGQRRPCLLAALSGARGADRSAAGVRPRPSSKLQRARNQVAAGAAAEADITRAQSGVADRVESIITADNLVRDRERELKRILNTPELDMEAPTTLVPATTPKPLYYQVDTRRAIEQAMRRRMELLDSELQIAADTAASASRATRRCRWCRWRTRTT